MTDLQAEAFRTVYDSSANLGQLVLLAHNIAQENHISGHESLQLMREAAVEMYDKSDPRRSKYQVDVYAGCEHGLIMNDYMRILEQKPDFLYVSDLGGSPFESYTKVIYYNKVINIIRAGKNANSPEIQDGYGELYSYVQSFSPDETSMPQPDDQDGIMEWIAKYTPSNMNHGTWMSSLSKDTRSRILDEIGAKTRVVVDWLKLIGLRGTRVILVPGNWDGQETLELIANGDGSAEARVEDFINIQDYAGRAGLEVLPDLSIVETDTTLTITVPFFWLKYDFENFIKSSQYLEIIEPAQEAKRKGKLIVCYPHAALFQSEGSGDNQKVAQRTLEIMRDLEVDEVAFGHFHDKTWKDRDGRVVDPRQSAIVYQFGDQRSFATYVPKGDIAVAVRRKNRLQQMTKSVLPARIL